MAWYWWLLIIFVVFVILGILFPETPEKCKVCGKELRKEYYETFGYGGEEICRTKKWCVNPQCSKYKEIVYDA